MALQPLLLEGRWQPPRHPAGSFRAVSPFTGTPLDEEYPISIFDEVERALRAGVLASEELPSLAVEKTADFFDLFARLIEERADAIVQIAHRETGLPEEPRLRNVELPRTTGQLRMAAEAVRERSWCRAVIDSRAGIRSMYGPLGGPVAVFGPGNFPLAFNAVAGGDFAAALAAGNPVIAKGHPLIPGTTRLLAETAFEAVTRAGLPPATVQMLYHVERDSGPSLVSHSLLAGTAFTGSRSAGLRLKEAADRAGKPIYLEMSSLNPLVLLPGALEERPGEIARELFESCALGAGQFCTKPGLVLLIRGRAADDFLAKVTELFRSYPPGVLSGRTVLDRLASSVESLRRHGAEILAGGRVAAGEGFRYANTLLRVAAATFSNAPQAFQAEAFGTASLVILAEDIEELCGALSHLEGSLAGSIYSQRGNFDEAAYSRVEARLRVKVGRLLNDRMPTGVAVSPAMNHGGPYPATGHPGFTAVGIPASLLRFAALRCYDGVRPHRLPPELKDRNPNGRMWRLIDGEWTRRDL